MKFLIAQYRLPYPLYISGADKFTMELAFELTKLKHDVTLMFCLGPLSIDEIKKRLNEHGLDYQENEKGIVFTFMKKLTIYVFFHDSFFKRYNEYVSQYADATIFHHYNLFDDKDGSIYRYDDWLTLFNVGNRHIVYIHSEDGLSIWEPIRNRFNLILTNSEYMKQQIKGSWNKQALVVLPIPNRDCIAQKKATFSNYITLFNPHPVKGSRIMYELIQRNPQRYFMVVLSWDKHIDFPTDASLHKRVLIVPAQHNVSEIYSYSRLVLIPSQWQEAFGRVQFEAAANGIPVCVSAVGGMQQYFSDNGILVNDYKNVDRWQKAIEQLDDKSTYNKAAQNALSMAESYSLKHEITKMIRVLEEHA